MKNFTFLWLAAFLKTVDKSIEKWKRKWKACEKPEKNVEIRHVIHRKCNKEV